MSHERDPRIKWETRKVANEGYALENELNYLQNNGYTIFQIIPIEPWILQIISYKREKN